MNKKIFTVKGYLLDDEQMKIVKSNAKNILVIAGAGSGKSLTIVGKIKYLIEVKRLREEEILCISFTNDSCNSLKSSILKELGCNVDVLTFHKLALNILKDANLNYFIAENSLLKFVVSEFINYVFVNDSFYKIVVLRYFGFTLLFRNVNVLYENIVIDSRLAWHFIPKSFKVFIDVNWKTAGERLLKAERETEKAENLDHAIKILKKRWKTENERYLSLYNINNLDKSQYDLVIKSDNKTIEEISHKIFLSYKKFMQKA